MRLSIRLVIFILFLSIQNSSAQNTGIKHFTIDDGLPSNNVFTILFDSKGYLWIGTDKGIGRYNGTEFKTFTTNNGLPDNEIFAFTEDTEGRMWISNFKGELCYYKDNVFHTQANTPWLRLNEKTPSNYFNHFQIMPDSSIVIASVNVRTLLIIKHNTIRKIPIGKLISNFANNGEAIPILITRPDARHFQLFYRYQSFLIDEKANIIKTIPYPDNKFHFNVNTSRKIYIATSDALYTPEGKILAYAPKYDTFKEAYLTIFPKYAYIKDKNTVFSSSKYGLFCNDSKQLLNEHLNMIDHDAWGNIWIASSDNGLFCLSQDFSNSYQYPDPIKNIAASSMQNGNLRLVTETGNVYHLSYNLTDASPVQNISTDHEQIKKYNTSITPSGDILNLQKPQLFYKAASQKSFRTVELDIDSKTDYSPSYKCVNDMAGSYYVSTIGSILKIKNGDLLTKSSLKLSDLIIYPQPVYDRIYYSAVDLMDSSVWFSKSNHTFYIKNGQTQEEIPLRNHTFRQFSFFKDYFVGISDKYRLYIYNITSKALDSIADSTCIWETIYNINDSTLFVNTDLSYKLIHLYPPAKTGRPVYSVSTVENPFLPKHADYILGDGKFYYFSKNGVLSGFPSIMIGRKIIPPRPVIVSFETSKTTYPFRPEVDIPYEESKAITIHIDNISFNDKNVITEYSISKNENDNWNEIAGNEISLNAIGMGFGKYTIKLRSKTHASAYSEPVVLILQIATPFWATWWFITLCVLAFIALILMVIRIIIWRQVRKRQREFDAEMKYQQSEYKALNALMNPHFIFNSLNNIQSLINKDHKETANQYLVIFSKLIRQNMLNVSKGYISLYQEMILIENYLYLEKLRFKELINFTIDIGEEIDTERVMIPPLLIQPVVENAIIHGLLPMQSENSKLSIRIFEVEDVIHVEITDNGIGLNQSLKKKKADNDSYGLSNLHRRIEHVKKFQKSNIEFEINELVDKNEKTFGTKACITIEQL